MSIGKTLAHSADAVKSATKNNVGRATGDARLRTEGRADQAMPNAKQARAKVQDAVTY